MGYTPNAAGAVWVGDPQHRRKMFDIKIGGSYHDKVYGADTPGPIWRDAMSGALANRPAPPLPTVAIDDGGDPGQGAPGSDDKNKGKGKGKGKGQPNGKGKPGHGGDNKPGGGWDIPGFPAHWAAATAAGDPAVARPDNHGVTGHRPR